MRAARRNPADSPAERVGFKVGLRLRKDGRRYTDETVKIAGAIFLHAAAAVPGRHEWADFRRGFDRAYGEQRNPLTRAKGMRALRRNPRKKQAPRLLRDMERPTVLGYELDRQTLTPIRRALPARTPGQDYGTDPLGGGMVRMVPSGDVVTAEEALRRLKQNPLTRAETATILHGARRARVRALQAPTSSPYRAYGMGKAEEAALIAYAFGKARRHGLSVRPRRPRQNPPAPRVVTTLPATNIVVRYRRAGKHPGLYEHKFAAGVKVQGMSDGSVRISGHKPTFLRDSR
jgi:hypothetical protein